MASEQARAINNDREGEVGDIYPDPGDTAKLLEDEEDPDVEDEIEYPSTGPRPEKKIYKIARIVLGIGTFVMLFGFLAAAITLIAVSPPCKAQSDLVWWKTTVIYQCYPFSFQDSSGNGIGDLKGIEQRAQYFSDLGVGTVWLNPIFKSPQKDNGYDISDYKEIDPLFGTMADFKTLLKEIHSKGIHLLMDFVPNHTSDEHPWFVESRSNANNSKKDWYVWADPNEFGGPPSNWISLFGGSAWTFDNNRKQYYLHQFSEFQPDLNYYNPDVRSAMVNILKFWLDMGVDGFRMDAVLFLLEDPDFRNETTDSSYNTLNCTANITDPDCYHSLVHNETSNYHGIHSIFREWRKTLDSYEDARFMVGEAYSSLDVVMTYYGTNNYSEFDFPFNFFLLQNKNWTGSEVSAIVSDWLENMPEGAWPNWVLGNHDNPRIASKVGLYLARALNVLLLTLPGTPTTYYGEEILMTDVYIPPNKTHDKYQGRDSERTPMQWNTSTNAGFTTADPWLPVSSNYTTYNVESESDDKDSMLTLYTDLVNLRTSNLAFQYANYSKVLNTTDLYAYHRYHKSSRDEFIVVVNFSTNKITVNLNATSDWFKDPQYELSTVPGKKDSLTGIDMSGIVLDGGEAVVIKGIGDSNKSCG